jgi:deazaflavin-dependent oxidoreductase (nitroreductase family)
MERPAGLDHPIVPKLIKWMSKANVWLYRKSGGRLGTTWRIGSAFPRGVPILLLTATGRKSGRSMTTPLLYIEDDERLVVVASQGGLRDNPQWYFNVMANPEVEVQVRTRVERRRAREASSDERAVLWPRLVARYPDFERYQSWTERTIPVILLESNKVS